MATLEAAIDARKAKIGAASFKSSTKVMERAALSVDRTVDRIDRRMRVFGRSAKGFRADTQQIAKSSRSMQRSLYRMERRMQTMVRSSDRLRKSTRATGTQIKKSFGGGSQLLRGFKNGLGAIGIAFTSGQIVRGVVNMTKELQNLQNRLRLVTNGSEDLANVQTKLANISVRTRSDLQANANLYSRLVINTKDLNISREELLLVTENINKANIISGATSREASNALIQLSQGLASNTLRGDELRSVLEQLPVVAEKIAEELGVGRGELRKLASEGKVDAQTIINAFNKVDEDLESRFAKTTETIGQTMSMIHNEAVLIVGELGKFALPIAFMQDVRESLTEFREMLEIINKVKIQEKKLTPENRQKEIQDRLRAEANARAKELRSPIGTGYDERFGKELHEAALKMQRPGSLLRPENLPKTPYEIAGEKPASGDPVDFMIWRRKIDDLKQKQQLFFNKNSEQLQKDIAAYRHTIKRMFPDSRHDPMAIKGPQHDAAKQSPEQWAKAMQWRKAKEEEEERKAEEERQREYAKTALGGLTDFQKDATEAVTAGAFAYEAASASAQAMGNSIYDLASGTSNLADAFRNMATSIVRSMARIISEMIALRMVMNIGSGLSSIGVFGSAPVTGTGGGGLGTPVGQLGGTSYSTVGENAHSGGTFSGPKTGYPVMLHGTERVTPLNSVTKEPLRSGTGGNTTIVNNTFNVVATDAKSFDDRFKDSAFRQSRFLGETVYGETRRNPQLQGRL